MKKTLVALAALAAATGAFAQSGNARALTGSGVEIFGVADITVSNFKTDNGTAGSVTVIDGGGRNESSRLGFRGVEDIGRGLGAAFWFEAGVNYDNGTGANTTTSNTAYGDRIAFNQTTNPVVPTATLNARQGLTFNRASVVSLLGKSFGEVRIGRDYNPAFWNYTVFDPFGTVGVGSALNVIGGPLAPLGVQAFPPGAAYPMVRTSNSIGWLSNDMSGFRLQVQAALSEQATGCVTPESAIQANTCAGANGDGKLMGWRLQYNSGPLNLALSSAKTTYGDTAAQAAPTTAVTFGTITTTVAGAALTTPNGTTIGASTAAAPFANAAAYRGNFTQTNWGGAYTMGATKFFYQGGTQTNDLSGAAVERKLSNTLVGVTHNMGALTLKASYNTAQRSDSAGATSEDGAKTTQTAVGAVYDLSKRTALFGTYSVNKLTAGAATAGALRATVGVFGDALTAGNSATATGIDIGVRHRF